MNYLSKPITGLSNKISQLFLGRVIILIGFSCRADTATIPALRQASNVPPQCLAQGKIPSWLSPLPVFFSIAIAAVRSGFTCKFIGDELLCKTLRGT
jgi:hypothetical protein